ncbi:MAG: CPXCG motif-containing cysteine-rich protein [Nannocystaceae bacterium]|nr:CPXCG motif-containing cysteine-rich protein [Myxococcales bacterium]
MDDELEVCCPYCGSWVSLDVDPMTEGEYFEDCEVCCRPWSVRVWRDEDGTLRVELDRA